MSLEKMSPPEIIFQIVQLIVGVSAVARGSILHVARQSVAEPVEQRAGTKGNAGQQSYRQRTTDDAGPLIIQRKNS
jgi:hypothetical protein